MTSSLTAEASRPVAQAGFGRWTIIALTLTGIFLSVYQLFNIKIFDVTIIEGSYLYLLAAVFLSMVFICFRWNGKKTAPTPWYDWCLSALAMLCMLYFALTAEQSLDGGWEYAPPQTARIFSLLGYVLILEATRRAGGTSIFCFVAIFSLYPTFADIMPGPISGFASPFMDVVPYHMISSESSFGIPMRTFGALVIGFILFGAILQKTGGGIFFNDLALSLVGRFRGGAAKVAIFASGFMGSMSGSVISNVLTTGAFSIPAMQKTGFSRRFAAATEACASTGGVLMPPIMGATAFIMASFLARPYYEIAIAAAIPSILYYFGLFVQIDAYAAKTGLKGLPEHEVPKLTKVLKQGWMYLFVFGILVFLMMALRQEARAPFYAVLLMLLISQFSKSTRLDLKSFGNVLVGIGEGLCELTAVLLGVGLIVGAFSVTGLAGTLVNDIVFLAGDSVLALLLMGALTSFIFGMGMTVTACYIFLAIVLAPALEQAGLNPLAVHLFILYWGMVSFITPPVALGAFAAATLVGAKPMATALESMRLGGTIYVVPFFFVLNPALVAEAPGWEVLMVFATAIIGVGFISMGLQGHLSIFGRLPSTKISALLRLILMLAGLFFAMPANEFVGLDHLGLSAIGLSMAIPVFVISRWYGKH